MRRSPSFGMESHSGVLRSPPFMSMLRFPGAIASKSRSNRSSSSVSWPISLGACIEEADGHVASFRLLGRCEQDLTLLMRLAQRWWTATRVPYAPCASHGAVKYLSPSWVGATMSPISSHLPTSCKPTASPKAVLRKLVDDRKARRRWLECECAACGCISWSRK